MGERRTLGVSWLMARPWGSPLGGPAFQGLLLLAIELGATLYVPKPQFSGGKMGPMRSIRNRISHV